MCQFGKRPRIAVEWIEAFLPGIVIEERPTIVEVLPMAIFGSTLCIDNNEKDKTKERNKEAYQKS